MDVLRLTDKMFSFLFGLSLLVFSVTQGEWCCIISSLNWYAAFLTGVFGKIGIQDWCPR